MRSLPALVVVTLSVGVYACGGTSKGAGATSPVASNASATGGSTSTVAAGGKDSNDLDHDTGGDDDRVVFEYGHAPTQAEAQTITAFVKRYYAAAAAADGRKACPMIYSIVAEAATEEYGRAPDPAALHGKTCAVVISKLFKEHHELRAEVPTLNVTAVRVEGAKALVVMSFGTTPEPRIIALHREGHAWKVQDLLDGGIR